MRTIPRSLIAVALAASAAATLAAQNQEGFTFRSGVELINVTTTVTDEDGRFVSGLRKEDFTVYEDGARQEVTQFSNERVPVSLGIVLDASGSMTSDKMSSARSAIDRFVYDLLGKDDQLFFMEFANRAGSRAGLDDRPSGDQPRGRARKCRRAARRCTTRLPTRCRWRMTGMHPKKALLVISDGNDTNSSISVGELRQLIRESEVLVYALGVDGTATTFRSGPTIQLPLPIPLPIPGRRRPAAFRRSSAAGEAISAWRPSA